ncbi:MAG: GH36-type glycosyl hydrolase domain-containing protein [Lachnospiraceae bacterium]
MKWEYVDSFGSFTLPNPDQNSYLYFPLVNEGGVMSSITPDFHGDSKTSQNTFLLEPVSSENLHTSMMTRNVWILQEGKRPWSATGYSTAQLESRRSDDHEEVYLNAGKLWHSVTRINHELGLESMIRNFCPPTQEQVEIMQVTVTNISVSPQEMQPVVAIPIYGRSADNYRDHRHVTALLHRIHTTVDGVLVSPTLSFDERGHQKNTQTYEVIANGSEGKKPIGFYPVMEDYIGEGGSLLTPDALLPNRVNMVPPNTSCEGYEAMGGIVFEKETLQPSESVAYQILLSYNGEGHQYLEESRANQAFEENCEFWKHEAGIEIETGNRDFDQWMSWVAIQPVLRRICGCSFMPHHDYGRGGRGWRDLWQDSLALLLSDRDEVRKQLIRYYDGVRADGSNATIIGVHPGEFVADRNAIPRVWMDHGLWPLITTNLYIQQTGDFNLLFEMGTYFQDALINRGEERAEELLSGNGKLTTRQGTTYEGSILEHILIQNLTAYYDVGEHNHGKLRGADWNDALDMAKEHGESVAFTAAYSGNLKTLIQLLKQIKENGIQELELMSELRLLLAEDAEIAEDPEKKQARLTKYYEMVCCGVSGEKEWFAVDEMIWNLEQKAEWVQRHIRETEWINDGNGHGWFNSYYDNHARQVEGVKEHGVRMMLTGQVFTILSGTATDEEVRQIIQTTDDFLYRPEQGGYCLNTDFHECKEDLGRMFGFAYGHKENGAVFSHMAVMYAYALYERGYAAEGYQVLKSLYQQASNFEVSRIYPGIPEYFNDRGRGMYHYLTGAASWFIYTIQNQVFGIRGIGGDLTFQPQLLKEQFDEHNRATIACSFAQRRFRIQYVNEHGKEAGQYGISHIFLDDIPQMGMAIARETLLSLDENQEHNITIILE